MVRPIWAFVSSNEYLSWLHEKTGWRREYHPFIKLDRESVNEYVEYIKKSNHPECTEKEIRKLALKNGRERYYEQCKYCGLSRPIKKADIGNNHVSMVSYDRDFYHEYQSYFNSIFHDICADIEIENQLVVSKTQQSDFPRFKEYDEYLLSNTWKEIREKVLIRDRGICQGCYENQATQVHHLEYPEVFGTEMLWTLVSVCISCHKRSHGR